MLISKCTENHATIYFPVSIHGIQVWVDTIEIKKNNRIDIVYHLTRDKCFIICIYRYIIFNMPIPLIKIEHVVINLQAHMYEYVCM